MSQEKFSPDLRAARQAALQLATAQHASELFTVHMLTALSAQSNTVFIELLRKSGVDIQAFHAFLANRSTLLQRLAQAPAKLFPSSEHAALLRDAENEAKLFGDTLISTEHILLAALKYRQGKELWHMFNLSYDKVSDLKLHLDA